MYHVVNTTWPSKDVHNAQIIFLCGQQKEEEEEKKKRFASLFWLSKKQLPEKVNSYTKQPHFLIYLFTYLDEQEEQ